MNLYEKTTHFNKILTTHFGTTYIIPKTKQYHDRKLSPKGWQYKKYGNSTIGQETLEQIKHEMTLVADYSQCAKNDCDLRFYQDLVFSDGSDIIRVTTNPSRSGASCSFTFDFYVSPSTIKTTKIV